MKTSKPTDPVSSPPGAGGFHSSRTLSEILERHLPGVHAKYPEIIDKLYGLLMLEAFQEAEVMYLLDTLSKDFTFNKHHLFTVLSGMSFLITTSKIQEINEVDLLMDARQDNFFQILSVGPQENKRDFAIKPRVSKQNLM